MAITFFRLGNIRPLFLGREWRCLAAVGGRRRPSAVGGGFPSLAFVINLTISCCYNFLLIYTVRFCVTRIL